MGEKRSLNTARKNCENAGGSRQLRVQSRSTIAFSIAGDAPFSEAGSSLSWRLTAAESSFRYPLAERNEEQIPCSG